MPIGRSGLSDGIGGLGAGVLGGTGLELSAGAGPGVDDLLIDDGGADHLLIDDTNTDNRKLED